MIETVNGGVRPQWSFDSIAKTAKLSPVTLPAHSMITGRSSFTFVGDPPKIMLPAVAAGVIKYRDIFGEPHLTEYCFSFFADQPIDFDGFPTGQPIRVSGVINEQCAKHNCDDEDCGPDWEKGATE